MYKYFTALVLLTFSCFSSSSLDHDLCSKMSSMSLSKKKNIEEQHFFKVNLVRMKEKDVSCRYFSSQATLLSKDATIHSPEWFQNENSLNLLPIADELLLKTGWNTNHLFCNLFVNVFDTTKDEEKLLEGTLSAKKLLKAEEEVFYKYSTNSVGNSRIIDFVSSPVSDLVEKYCDEKKIYPLSQKDIRPLQDQNNHGDRLALDTVSTNTDLFFSLIKKVGHREDFIIKSMGLRYQSSYDACNNCFEKIYDSSSQLKLKLNQRAKEDSYKIKDDFEFHSLFYANRPYRDTSYHVLWKNPSDEENTWYKDIISQYKFSYGKPVYSFDFAVDKDDKFLFKNRGTNRLDMISSSCKLSPNKVYSYVREFNSISYSMQ
jgi:hypothetical protein